MLFKGLLLIGQVQGGSKMRFYICYYVIMYDCVTAKIH